MARGRMRGGGRFRGCRSLRRRPRRNSWTSGRFCRLDDSRAWRRRNLRGLYRWNGRRLRNRNGWSRRRRLCFDGAGRRRGRAARHGNNRSGRRWNRGRRRRRSYGSGFHTGRSCGCFLRRFIRYGLLFRSRFRIRERTKMLAHLDRGLYFDRTGMRFFLGNAGLGQIVDDGLGLYLQLASQFVDSDLIRIGHCPPGRLLLSLLV
jgi:hypothetical protein